MGRALLPQHDAGEREIPPQGPLWRAGGPAMLRVLILALLWRGSLSQPPGFTLVVPQLVSVQEGLCVFVPCNFTYPASYDTDNPSAQLYGKWYKKPATAGQDPPVASSVPNVGVSQETQGRFRLTGDPAHGNCSLQISDARRTDAGRYFLNIEKGMLDHTYRSNSDGTDFVLTISVPELTEEPEIQISPARGLPGTLLAGEPVTVTCTAPGRCSGSPPQVTWMGPFNDTARNVSAQLANGTWAHSSELSFTPGLGDNGKELVCTVTYSSAQGPSTSRTIQLHVGYPPGPPNITGNLTRNGRLVPDAWRDEGDVMSLKTQEGDSLSLSCEAGSRADANLSWAKGNESLSSRQGGAGHLELTNLSRVDAGEYRCWAKNFYGSASRALRVHVQYPTGPPNTTGNLTTNGRPDPTTPPITTGNLTRNGRSVLAPLKAECDIVSLETQEGDSLSLSCEAGSRANTNLSWAKGNESLSPSKGGAGRLELPNLSRGNAGEYRCWAKNSYGSASRNLRVHVQHPTGPPNTTGNLTTNGLLVPAPLKAESDIVSLETKEGDSLSLNCEAGSRAGANLSWAKGNESLSSRQGGDGRLELPYLSRGDSGEYRC
ncbi:sialic acid-binding Ig-like lectin 13 [Chrysemys picta bellii]|uniref:sialic acid-binding Ig-like lectin 13 n=1 Tax=Chrysemys picta bellii TaxID=8478 RepID=UPI0032B213EE